MWTPTGHWGVLQFAYDGPQRGANPTDFICWLHTDVNLILCPLLKQDVRTMDQTSHNAFIDSQVLRVECIYSWNLFHIMQW